MQFWNERNNFKKIIVAILFAFCIIFNHQLLFGQSQKYEEKALRNENVQEAKNKIVDELIIRLNNNSEDLSAIHELRKMGDKKCIPDLKKAFTKTNNKNTKETISSAIVSLGDDDPFYFNYLAENARAVVESDVPFPLARNKDGEIIPKVLNKEFLEWCKINNFDPAQKAQEIMSINPGSLIHLSVTADPRAFDIFLKGLESNNYVIVIASAKGLANLQDERAVKPIINACKRFPKNEISGIASTLIYFDSPEAQSAVREFIDNPEYLNALIDQKNQKGGKGGLY